MFVGRCAYSPTVTVLGTGRQAEDMSEGGYDDMSPSLFLVSFIIIIIIITIIIVINLLAV